MIASMPDLIRCLSSFHAGLLSTPELPTSAIPPDLPDPLAVLYRHLGALVALTQEQGGPFCGQDILLPTDRLKRVNGMVEFAWENQGNWSCRCPAGPGDPPVFSDAVAYWDPAEVGFARVCDSLQHFLTTLCLQEAVMSAPFVWQVSHSGELKDAFVAVTDPLWLRGRYVHRARSHNFFEASAYDAIVMEHQGLWVGAHTETAARLVRPGIPCDRIR